MAYPKPSQKYLNYHTAVSIIRRGGIFTFQLKTPGYPIQAYVGGLNLFGGTWTNAEDRSPFDTIVRELSDELTGIPPSLRERVKPFAEYFIHVPASIIGREEHNYRASVFELEVDGDITSNEGIAERVDIDDLVKKRVRSIIGGYHRAVEDYLETLGVGTEVNGFGDIFVVRLDSDPSAPYEQRELDWYKKIPLASGNLTDRDIFRGTQ